MNNYHDEEKWSVVNIFVRIIAYPFCVTFIFAGIYSVYIILIALNEPGSISEKESFVGIVLSAFLIFIPFLYLYYDLKNIFSKSGYYEESDILDGNL